MTYEEYKKQRTVATTQKAEKTSSQVNTNRYEEYKKSRQAQATTNTAQNLAYTNENGMFNPTALATDLNKIYNNVKKENNTVNTIQSTPTNPLKVLNVATPTTGAGDTTILPQSAINEYVLEDVVKKENKANKRLDSNAFVANYTAGDIQTDLNAAYNDYSKYPSEANRLKVERLETLNKNYAENATNVGKGGIITKDLATHLPQQVEQLGAGIEGAIVGALPGLVTFNPAVAAKGAGAGYTANVSQYSYEQMQGGAYKDLLDMGVPSDIALKVSRDSAMWQALIEGAGAVADIMTLGAGKLLTQPAKTATQATAKQILKEALKAYGYNLISEAVEEGAQEYVGIKGEKVAMAQAELNRETTAQDDWKRVGEAAKGGAILGGLMGGVNLAGNVTTNLANNAKIQNLQKNIALESAQTQETTATNEVTPTEGVNSNTANVVQNSANTQNIAQNEVANQEKATYNEVGGVENGRNGYKDTNVDRENQLAQIIEREKSNSVKIDKTQLNAKRVTNNPMIQEYEKTHNKKAYMFDGIQPSFIDTEGNAFFNKKQIEDYGFPQVEKHESVEELLNNHTEKVIKDFTPLVDKIMANEKGMTELFNLYKIGLTAAQQRQLVSDPIKVAKEALCDVYASQANHETAKEFREIFVNNFGKDLYDQINNTIQTKTNEILKRKSSEQQGSFLMPTAEQLNKPSQEMTEGAQALTLEEKGWKPSEGEADILDDTQKKRINVKELAKDTVQTFKRMFVDSGTDIAEIGKIAGDTSLYHKYNSAKQAGQSANYMISDAQTNWQGDKVGKSLVEIFEPIRNKGKDYYKQFQYYMYHLHNINRMEQGKPVFGENITADESRRIAEKLSKEYPEFNDYAEDIRKWNANLQQYRIDTGLISQEQADMMNEMYPNYVPTYRDVNGISGATKNGNTVKIVNTIKKATGSDKNILPLHEQMARQVMQTVQAGRRNVLGMQLYNDVMKNTDKLGKYVQEIKTAKENVETDSDFEFEKQDLEGKFVVFNNGEQIQMQVSKGVLDGLKSLTSTMGENNVLSKAMTKFNGTFKKLVTEWNPGFIVKNAARDIQDAGFYSENAKEFYKNYPEAWKEITNNGELWQKYLAMGGSDSSLFDFEQGYNIPKTGLGNKVVDAIGTANFCVEQAPRFAEFLRLYKESDKSYDALMDAMYGAADITVNFGRSGTWGKFINNNLVPFFNPAIQGTDKTIRTLLGTDSKIAKENYAKHIANIVGKGLALGVAPTMINHILLEAFGGDDYDDITERDKDLYFLIPVGKGKFIKIPKGRVLSVMGGAARRGYEVATGNKDAFEGFGEFMLDQTAPMNPFENSLYGPIAAVKNNTTWYGTPIENESMQNLRPEQRYDEGTTEFAKWLGDAINYSPKKIDYLMDAYGGVLADTAMPLMTKKAETSGFGKSFVLDSTYSNRLSTDFYDTIQELTYDKNDDDPIASMQLKYMNDAKSRAQDINKEIKDVQASDMDNKEKLNKVKELRKEVNSIQREALNTYEKYGETANKYIENEEFEKFVAQGFTDKTTEESKTKAIDKMVKTFTDRDVFGAEYALAEYDSDVANKQQKVEEYGIDAETFFKAYFAQKYVKGTPGPNGKTISGSESRKKKEAIDKATENLSKYQRRALYKEFGVGESVW